MELSHSPICCRICLKRTPRRVRRASPVSLGRPRQRYRGAFSWALDACCQ